MELARRGAFTPDRDLKKRLKRLRAEQAVRVLAPGDLLFEEERAARGEYRGLEGRAWCPTPQAVKTLEAAGLAVPRAPSLEVLRLANDRAFNAELGQTLPGAVYSRDLDELEAALNAPEVTGAWLCKRAFGVSGRGQRRVTASSMADADVAWLAASLKLGGVQLEPLVVIDREYAIHGWLDENGEVELSSACRMDCDVHGAWVDTRHAEEGELATHEWELLLKEAGRVARALAAARYHGPFGIDAYRWKDAAGELRMNPRSEINARYTLGWRVSFPER